MRSSKKADYDAIVVGAGFSGIRSLWELGQLGLTAKCFEAGSDVGGAWYWNRYPGARTDSEAWVYAMNFIPELKDEWNYSERYPSQQEVQRYLSKVVDHFHLRENIEFDTRIRAAHYSDSENIWTITTAAGLSTTCRYFLAASGPLSVTKAPPFAGLESYTGEWYQTSIWPTRQVDFRGKRVAIVGTGATGVQIIPKLAHVAKELTVFQRTPNYVLPGRNYAIDEDHATEIKQNYDATWNRASTHPFGLAMTASGKTVENVTDARKIKQILDAGWESGGFHFQFETLDDLFTNQESNDIASEYLRQKIHAVVQDPNTAKILSPKYPFLSKRPPCGHFYYEAYNRPNVKLVDISRDDIALYEKGIRTSSGVEYEFDVIIFALGFDAGTGALSEMDVKGCQGNSLGDHWAKRLETFAGVLVPGFPNMFLVCGPHVPFGNMPVVLEIGVSWIGKTLRHMEKNKLTKIDVSQTAVDAWSSHLDEAFRATLFAESAKASGAWFVGANIPGKAANVLFYFGGVPTWNAWLENETRTAWANMIFSLPKGTEKVGEYPKINSQSQTATDIISSA
ncbi:cyclohexanone monooxygenase [Hyaloscypha variabilis F]|uniref:Cyclohexanone monooxygenase n=1 Tax=Hyaloscypha variabilis (strain UAMH 11265 / GT02V1 / F) TaxID=1149755 RepID=A0A2J6R3E5_HYAVF|nr:cyclohexanone monooxygenase [Hyaloscypha variabilis F]